MNTFWSNWVPVPTPSLGELLPVTFTGTVLYIFNIRYYTAKGELK